MLYQEFQVPAPLQNYIWCYWKFLGPAGPAADPVRHYIMPDACPSLIFYRLPAFDVRGSILFGPTKFITETEVFPGSITVGIRFKAGYSSGLFQRDGLSLRDQTVRPAPQWPGFDQQQVLDNLADDKAFLDYFNRQLPEIISGLTPRCPEVVEEAISLIMQSKGNIKIADLLSGLPLSERQIQKTFKKEVGLTLKEFATTMRVRAAIIQMELEQENYQDTVFNSGYYVQAHFIRDCTKLSKISLPDFKKYIINIRHVGVSFRS